MLRAMPSPIDSLTLDAICDLAPLSLGTWTTFAIWPRSRMEHGQHLRFGLSRGRRSTRIWGETANGVQCGGALLGGIANRVHSGGASEAESQMMSNERGPARAKSQMVSTRRSPHLMQLDSAPLSPSYMQVPARGEYARGLRRNGIFRRRTSSARHRFLA